MFVQRYTVRAQLEPSASPRTIVPSERRDRERGSLDVPLSPAGCRWTRRRQAGGRWAGAPPDGLARTSPEVARAPNNLNTAEAGVRPPILQMTSVRPPALPRDAGA